MTVSELMCVCNVCVCVCVCVRARVRMRTFIGNEDEPEPSQHDALCVDRRFMKQSPLTDDKPSSVVKV
jgi:hypothetical protein